MPSRFLIPSVLWYGLPPAVDGVAPAAGTPPLWSGWGGRITAEDDVRAVLVTVEPVLLLLELAGYEVPEVAIGIPSGADPTAADELVVVALETMEVERGTRRPWTPVVGPAVVGLWLVPRYPVATPAEGVGPTLALDRLAAAIDPAAIELPIPDPGGGWLRLGWAPASEASWPAEVALLTQMLSDALAGELARQRALAYAADAPGKVVPLCGLLGLYDPRTWRMPAQLDPAEPLTAYVAGFGERLTALVDGDGGFRAFLDGERLPAPDASAEPPEPGPPSIVGRWLGDDASWEERQAITDDLSYCATELEVQTYDAPLVDERALAFERTAVLSFQQLSLTQALLFWQEVGALDFLSSIDAAVDAAYGTSLYGGWALQRGDKDAGHVYEGHARTEPVPGAGERGYIAQLRADLAMLGFGPQFGYALGESSTATFDVDLERAVREFQIAASAPGGARYEAFVDEETPFYADHLVGIVNPDPYTGPISGVVNARSRTLIRAWLDDDLRCPVVIEARLEGEPDQYTEPYAPADADNLWKPDQVATGAPRMFARDFSGRWTLPAGSERELHEFVLGEWTQSRTNASWKGPRIYASRECWAECEVTPDTLVGAGAAALDAEAASTFRVVRAVSEVECQAFLDGIQCWDSGVLSLGLCHWTLALTSDAGELPAYLAYLKGVDVAAYEAAFGTFGCSPVESWPAGTSQSGTTCWNPEQRKYESWIALEDDEGRPDPAPVADRDTKEWFRHWHWMLRFAMAARTLDAFRRRMWEAARFRLRDILRAPFPDVLFRDQFGNPVQATLGEVFTSERTVALLLRWHVNRPAHLFPPPGTQSRLKAPYDLARGDIAGDWGDPVDWTDAMQAALHQRVYDAGVAASPELRDTLPLVDGWGRAGTGWTRAPYWQLDYDAVANTPRVGWLDNASTPVDQPYTVALAIDWRHVVPGFERSVRCIVVDDDDVLAGVEVDLAGSLTATPNWGATGDAIITVVADNGSQTGSTAFWLTVGADPKPEQALAPPAEAPTTGLSLRRNSFRLLFEDLP